MNNWRVFNNLFHSYLHFIGYYSQYIRKALHHNTSVAGIRILLSPRSCLLVWTTSSNKKAESITWHGHTYTSVKATPTKVVGNDHICHSIKHKLDVGGISGTGHVAVDLFVRWLILGLKLGLDVCWGIVVLHGPCKKASQYNQKICLTRVESVAAGNLNGKIHICKDSSQTSYLNLII